MLTYLDGDSYFATEENYGLFALFGNLTSWAGWCSVNVTMEEFHWHAWQVDDIFLPQSIYLKEFPPVS